MLDRKELTIVVSRKSVFLWASQKTEMTTTPERILVIGSNGQIGSELVLSLRQIYGVNNVIASDINPSRLEQDGPFQLLNVLDKEDLGYVVSKYKISQVYLLAAFLSATAEKYPLAGWKLNMEGLLNVLELAKEKKIRKVYWPSSIAAFGPTTPKDNTPQNCVMDPSTVYGISKQAGERWCEYYYNKFDVDVRGLRYPGLLSYKSLPGGGTTDYAIHIFHEARQHKSYTSFLSENTTLPMMYMPDAIKATIGIMESPAEKIKIRSSYNLAGCSFAPHEIAAEIKTYIPDFTIKYQPDFRQAIADSWPRSIDDSAARADWGWKHEFGLKEMVKDMLENIR